MSAKTTAWVRRGSLAASTCVALVTFAGAAHADSDDENARRHFESGAAYLEQSDYADALHEFQSAYTLSKRPELLLNVATVDERMGNLVDAIDALTRYLTEAPETTERTTIETRIANLKKRLEDEQSAAAAAKEQAAAAAPPPLPPPAAKPPPPPPPSSPPARPNRTGAYVAWGIGGAAVVGAVVTGVLAQSKYDDAKKSCVNACSDDTVSSIKTMALVSDVLTGAAVAGAGVGLFLFLTAKPQATESAGPRLSGAVLPGRASVEATWRF